MATPTQSHRTLHRAPSGFTLVELLVVITILGVLSAVVVFAVSGTNDRGQVASCNQDARTLKTAIETHIANNGAVPADQAALVSSGFLQKPSTLNDFTVNGNRYTIVGGSQCATGYAASITGSAPIAYYRLGDALGSGTAADGAATPHNGTVNGTVTFGAASNLQNDADTAATFNGNGSISLTGLPTVGTAGAATTVEFWMKWDGTSGIMPFGWWQYDLWFNSGGFGFNNGCSNVEGTSSTGMANRWVHVAAVFVSGDLSNSKLYIDGVLKPQSHFGGSAWQSCAASAVVTQNAKISGWLSDGGYQYRGVIDEFAIFNGELPAATIAAHYAAR